MTSRLSEAVAELYAGDAEVFTSRRKELAAQARAADDKTAAKEIAALGKPTRSASLINQLVWADPTVPARLAELGDQLRAGDAAPDGPTIRKLSAARRDLVEALVRQATARSAPPASAAVREEIADTFNAALADPLVASDLAAGRLLRAARWAGFGLGIGTGTAPGFAPGPPPKTEPRQGGRKPGPADPGQSGARSPAERRERQRAEAERAVADASLAADAAAAAEREQQQAVKLTVDSQAADRQALTQAEQQVAVAQHDLVQAQRALADAQAVRARAEQRQASSRTTLARERDRLAEAGTAARQAARKLRTAQQVLDRLPAQP